MVFPCMPRLAGISCCQRQWIPRHTSPAPQTRASNHRRLNHHMMARHETDSEGLTEPGIRSLKPKDAPTVQTTQAQAVGRETGTF